MILRIRPAGAVLAAYVVLLSMALSGSAQLTTITTSNALGQTVVVQESLAGGVPVASTVLTTLTGSTTTSTTTTDDGGGGPVGYTTSTTGQIGPTTYVYTTTDQFGSRTVVTDVFTPTYEPTSPWPTVPSGTIIDYSAYTSTNPEKTNRARTVTSQPLNMSSMGVIVALCTVLCVATGGLIAIL